MLIRCYRRLLMSLSFAVSRCLIFRLCIHSQPIYNEAHQRYHHFCSQYPLFTFRAFFSLLTQCFVSCSFIFYLQICQLIFIIFIIITLHTSTHSVLLLKWYGCFSLLSCTLINNSLYECVVRCI